MRILLLYRGEYSQWRERFMNYLEEQTDGEAMINFIQNCNQPLHVIAQVSLAGNAQNAPPTLKDPKYWTAKEKKTRKIDRLARSLLIQGIPNDIYSLIDSNKTTKDLWDALERQMCGSKYAEQDRKACGYKKYNCELNYKFLNNLQPKWKQYGTLMRDVNDALRYKKKAVVVTSDPLALVAEKTNVSKRKEKVVVSLDYEGSGTDDFSELKKKTTLLAKAFNRRKFYSKQTNNNLRTSSTSQSANKKQEFVKSNDKKEDKKSDEKKRDMCKVKCYNCKKEGHFAKDCKKAKVKDYNYYKTKMLLAKKDSDEQVLLAEDQAWMESSSDFDPEINANMVFMAQIENVLSESDESSSSAKETIAEVAYYTSKSKKIFHDAIESASENFIKNHIDSQKDYDKSEVDHNDPEEKENLVDKLIQKFNHKISKCQKHIEIANQQSKDFKNQNKDLQEKYNVLINQVNTFEEKNNEFNEQIKVLNEKNVDLLDQTKVLKDQIQVKHVVVDNHVECHIKYAKLKEERYEYMIRYSALCDNDKQHRKKIDEQEVLFDKMSVELVELDKHVRDLKNKVLEKDFKISKLEECVSNKDLKIEKCLECLNVCENKIHTMGQTNQTIHMIMPSKDNLYNGRKGIGFENLSYFEKAKYLRPTLYDEKVIGLGYTLMFLTYSDEALEIEKFKRSRENKIEFAYDYGNLNARYVNEKINFEDGYFQEIINPILKRLILRFSKQVHSNHMFLMMYDEFDDNNFFIFDDVSVIISPVSKMPFRKKPRDSMNIVQIYLWIINSECSKHMTGNRALLTNFVERFLETGRFGDNDFAVIAGYGDVGLEVAFRKSTCFVRNKDGVDLLTGDRSSNLYTIALNEVASNSLTCLLAKPSSLQSWLSHQRLSHLNFATINNLVKNNLVQGLPKMKFEKDHLCSACE
nr:hypothetical protein [Tanacetum cinerariifolium]